MMAQLPYYRDVWCLGPQKSEGENCPGQFPRGFISRMMNLWGKGKKDKLMLFSGAFHEPGWITVDIRAEMKPIHVADCEHLPFNDSTFDLVVMDPPYSEQEAKALYGLKYVHLGQALNEAARVVRPGGVVALLHRLVPVYWSGQSKEFSQLKVVGVIGVFTLSGMSNMRALTVWRKMESLDEMSQNRRLSDIKEG